MAQERVRIAWSGVSPANSPIWVVQEKGLLKKHGLNDLESSYQAFLPRLGTACHRRGCGCTKMLNCALHPSAKTAEAKTLIDDSVPTELGKSGFVEKLYK
jgi:hypothetical protein